MHIWDVLGLLEIKIEELCERVEFWHKRQFGQNGIALVNCESCGCVCVNLMSLGGGRVPQLG